MLNVLNQKESKNLLKKLEQMKFFTQEMENFNIEKIVEEILTHHQFDAFVEVVQMHSLGHFGLTKVILVFLSLIQVKKSILESLKLQQFICYLSQRIVKLQKRPVKVERKIFKSLSPKNLFVTVENVLNGQNSSGKRRSSKEKQNRGSFLVKTILKPLLNLIERIIACYDQVYRPKESMNDEMCWATLNLLLKFGELDKNFEQVGRYYNQQFGEIIYETVKVLDYDIRILYKRMVNYLKKNINSVQTSIMQGKHERLTEQEEENIKQILMFVDQIDKLNDSLRVIYLGKYFAKTFASRGLRNVILFRGSSIVDSLSYFLRNQQLQRHRKSSKNLLKVETQTTIGTQKSVRERVNYLFG